jgi:hypothetical protein
MLDDSPTCGVSRQPIDVTVSLPVQPDHEDQMPIRIDELTVPNGAPAPEWFAPAAAQIAAIASDMAAQTKAMAKLQQQVDELRALVLQQIRS